MHVPHRQVLTRLVAGLALASLAACGTETSGSADEPLRNVEIPADFTFATTRSAAITVEAPVPVIPTGGELVVERPDGAVLFRGALRPDTPMRVPVLLPTATKVVILRLTAEHASWRAEVTLDGAEARHTFTEEG